MNITPQEIAETLAMVSEQNLDLRTITMGISLNSCADEDLDRMCQKVYDRITRQAEHLVSVAEDLEREYGIPIANKRVSVTPIAQIAACTSTQDLTPLAHTLDRAAETLGIDFLGGFSALVHKGLGDADRRLIASIPEALATTRLFFGKRCFHARGHQHGRCLAHGRNCAQGRASHHQHPVLRCR